MQRRTHVPRLQVLPLYKGGADADLSENLHKSDHHKGDGHQSEICLGDQPRQQHDEQELQQHLAHHIGRLPSDG